MDQKHSARMHQFLLLTASLVQGHRSQHIRPEASQGQGQSFSVDKVPVQHSGTTDQGENPVHIKPQQHRKRHHNRYET